MCALLRLSTQSILCSNSQMGEMSGGNVGTQFSSHYPYPPFSRHILYSLYWSHRGEIWFAARGIK